MNFTPDHQDVPNVWQIVPKSYFIDDGYPEPNIIGILCPHGKKRRDYCVDCGGSQICACGERER